MNDKNDDESDEHFVMSIFQRALGLSQALESFRSEILEKSQKQENQIKEQGEIIASQEVRIAQMDERVLKLELAADQQNLTNQDVNRTTGIIAKDSGNTTTTQLISSV